MPNLFRKKAVAYDNSEFGLRRCLSALDLTLLGIGAIIGTGIFVLTGIAAATQSGPAVVLSFVRRRHRLHVRRAVLCRAASSVGGCGSAYGYSYAAFGELIAWIIAWDLILEYGVSVAAVANGWSGYFNNALSAMGIGLPVELTKGPFAGGLVNLPAFFIVLGLMVMLIIGVKESARLNGVMVAVKLTTIAIFLAVAIFNIHPANWSPFAPFGWFEHTPEGKPVGILAGASLVFFAYVGFDAVSTAVEEAHDPQRDIPRGLLASLIFCTIIYIVVSGVLTGIVNYTELNVNSPVAFALQKIGFNWASALVAAGVITGLTTVMLVLYYALTRIIVGVSRDGLLPEYYFGGEPEDADAGAHDRHHRSDHRGDVRLHSTRGPGRTRQHRHARRLRARLRRRDCSQDHASRPAAAVQDARAASSCRCSALSPAAR